MRVVYGQNETKGMRWSALKAGEVYEWGGMIFLMTNGKAIVCLETGEVFNEGDFVRSRDGSMMYDSSGATPPAIMHYGGALFYPLPNACLYANK